MLRYLLVAFLFVEVVPVHAQPKSNIQENWMPNRYKIICKNEPCYMEEWAKEDAATLLTEVVSNFRGDNWKPSTWLEWRRGSRTTGFIELHETNDPKGLASRSIACGGHRASIRFGAQYQAENEFVRYSTVAHELTHLLVLEYPAFSKWCGQNPGWVYEGLAELIGLDITKRNPKVLDIGSGRDEREALRNAGLRNYSIPLNVALADSEQKVKNTGVFLYYRTHSFWRHIVDNYHGGDYKVLRDRYFDTLPEENDWINWLHKQLQADPAMRGKTLAHVFATFVADFATWYQPGKRGEYFKKAEWFDRAFSDCHSATVSPTNPMAKFEMRLLPTSAKCVNIEITGVKPGQTVTLRPISINDNTAQADQLHLSLAESEDFNCANELRAGKQQRQMAFSRCLLSQSTGGVKLTESVTARVWDSVEYTVKGTTSKNLFLVSRVDVSPRKNQTYNNLSFELSFVLDTVDLEVAGERPVGGNQRSRGTVNMDPHTAKQGIVPKYNQNGSAFVPPINLDALHPVPPVLQAPFHIPTKVGDANGLSLINVSYGEAEIENFTEIPKPDWQTLGFMPLDSNNKPMAIMMGQTGTFNALPITKGGKPPGLIGLPGTGTIKVKQFTPWVLVAELSGTFCKAVYKAVKNCPNPFEVKATVVRGLVNLYLPGSKFFVEDTPGTQQYHALTIDSPVSAADRERLEQAQQAIGGSAGSVLSKGCECKCNDIEELRELQDSLDPKQGERDPKVAKMGMCFISCMSFYQTNCHSE